MLTVPARGAISRHGLWRESVEIVSPDKTPIGAALYTFKVRLWPTDVGLEARCSDWNWSPGAWGLCADTTDPNHVVAISTDTGLIITWSFPASETHCLTPGAHRGSITAQLLSDPTVVSELSTFNRVVLA